MMTDAIARSQKLVAQYPNNELARFSLGKAYYDGQYAPAKATHVALARKPTGWSQILIGKCELSWATAPPPDCFRGPTVGSNNITRTITEWSNCWASCPNRSAGEGVLEFQTCCLTISGALAAGACIPGSFSRMMGR